MVDLELELQQMAERTLHFEIPIRELCNFGHLGRHGGCGDFRTLTATIRNTPHPRRQMPMAPCLEHPQPVWDGDCFLG